MNVAEFKQVGTKLLENVQRKRSELMSSFDPPKTEGVITRMMAADRRNLEEEIMYAAKKYNINSGKWMLFPMPAKVDKYWEVVVRGTVEGRLGSAAKVATRPDNTQEPTQVICIYTEDITDEEDIKRVLKELVRLKLTPAIAGPSRRGEGIHRGQIW